MSKILRASSSVSDAQQSKIKNMFKTMDYDAAKENVKCGINWVNEFITGLGCFLNGKWVTNTTEEAKIAIPSTGTYTVSLVRIDIFKQAATTADAANASWTLLSGHERAKYLYRIAKKVQEQSYLFAVLESWGTGKPISQTKSHDVPNMICSLYHFAGWAELWETEMSNSKPYGIIAVMPNQFNDPLMSICWHVGAALAAGNCVILLPHVTSCMSALLFAQLCESSGLPPGVFSVLPFHEFQYLDLLKCAQDLKCQLNCGFKMCCGYDSSTLWERFLQVDLERTFLNLDLDFNHSFSPSVIVLEDADLHSAVRGILQCCTFYSRTENCCQVLVQDSIKEKFLTEFKLKFNDPEVVTNIVAVDQDLLEENENGAMVTHFPSPSLDICQLVSINDRPADQENCSDKKNLKTLNILFFRTTKEAVEIFNNRKTGRSVCVWSEKMTAYLEVADKVKSGTVWINCQNEFDPAVGHGGAFLCSGIREGGKLSLMQFVKPNGHPVNVLGGVNFGISNILPKKIHCGSEDKHFDFQLFDQVFKLFYGGVFKLPEGNSLIPVVNFHKSTIGHITEGTGKDICSAVESAKAAQLKWGNKTGFDRAQVLRSIAENLEARKKEFSYILSLKRKNGTEEIPMCEKEVEMSIQRIFYWAAHADKSRGVVQETQMYGKVLETLEPLGVIGILCPDDCQLLSFISLLIPAIALGNSVVVIPSEDYPLPALKMCEIFEASNVPAGVVNVISGSLELLTPHLALHSEVESIWLHLDVRSVNELVQHKAVIMNKKRVWKTKSLDWLDPRYGQGIEFIYHSTYNKTIWFPLGNML